MSPAEARASIESFMRESPGRFALLPDDDGRGARILEAGTGKTLGVRWDEVAEAVVRQSPLRPAPYLVVVFADGRQVALADVGFAFAPVTTSTGPLPDLPATFCFRDFGHLAAGAAALLGEDGREREAVAAVMLGIALLDGARAVGFDVSREERELDSLLRRLEERGARV
ncbi:MAG: hypothetical protein ACJ79H_13815 [Myxococcales bacterium]